MGQSNMCLSVWSIVTAEASNQWVSISPMSSKMDGVLSCTGDLGKTQGYFLDKESY